MIIFIKLLQRAVKAIATWQCWTKSYPDACHKTQTGNTQFTVIIATIISKSENFKTKNFF